MPRFLSTLLLLPLLYSLSLAADNSKDALAPKSSVDDALALPLHTVTVATTDLEASLLFYQQGFGLVAEGPIELDKKTKQQQRSLWQIDTDIDWQTYLLRNVDASGNTLPGVAQIRLLLLNKPTPTIHQSWSAMELGPFSMGFPNDHQEKHDKHMREIGFGSLNVIEIYQVPRTDGTKYTIYETIHNGPDFAHGVGIQRGDGMSQLGALNPAGLGGPAYSAQVVADSNKVISFYTEVLGMELRSDRLWKSAGRDGALNVPDGTEFRFAIVYSKGATSGHMLFVEYKNRDAIDPGVAPRLPNRGIAMWTYPVKDMDKVLANAKAFGSPIVQSPVVVDSPVLGKVVTATIEAPNGFVVEVFEQQ